MLLPYKLVALHQSVVISTSAMVKRHCKMCIATDSNVVISGHGYCHPNVLDSIGEPLYFHDDGVVAKGGHLYCIVKRWVAIM